MRRTATNPSIDDRDLARLAERAPATRVICLGLSALDHIWDVDVLLDGGQKIRAKGFETRGGGMAASAAAAAARLGAQAAFWGRGGADAAGEAMKAQLAGAGVDVAAFRLFADGRSSVSGVIVDAAGERQIVNFRGSFPDAAAWLPLERVDSASVVLADPRWPAGAGAMFARARSAGVPTALDADMADAQVFEDLLPLTDHAIFSEPALAQFAGRADEDALRGVAGRGCRIAAVTRGARGVRWIADGESVEAPAFAVDVRDTTGAGDVFHGAYAFAIGAGLGVGPAMIFASAAAALKCMRPGAREGAPTLVECLNFLRMKR